MRADVLKPLTVVCLCAAWCQVCAAYAPLLESQAHPGFSVEWIDIEDESDLIGDWEVEQFPTLLVFDAEQVYFAGPLRPDISTLRRVMASCEKRSHERGTGLEVSEATHGLVRRIQSRERVDTGVVGAAIA